MLIKDKFSAWEKECDERFNTLKANEEELNRIFIGIYGLQEELPPEAADKDIAVRKADLVREIKSLISYAVGCMLGRYTIYKEGLFYAGGHWDYDSKVGLLSNLARECGSSPQNPSGIFLPDKDNIIPICGDEYFTDDIVGRFVEFISKAYGEEALEENLKFIADVLSGNGSSREVIRNYFIKDFCKDHIQAYKKRPIYWQFDSGKKNGFKALVYMHRYTPDLPARMRTDYVHEQQERYSTALSQIENDMKNANKKDKARLTKQQSKIKEQADELARFEEKIHHLADMNISIDLDDGVKVSYAKFKDVLVKVK